MNKQEIFDKVYGALKKQGFEQCVDKQGNIVFNNEKGQCCAIGHLVPGLEETDKLATMYNDGRLSNEVPFHFYSDLMHIHDTWTEPENMKDSFEKFAEEEGLCF